MSPCRRLLLVCLLGSLSITVILFLSLSPDVPTRDAVVIASLPLSGDHQIPFRSIPTLRYPISQQAVKPRKEKESLEFDHVDVNVEQKPREEASNQPVLRKPSDGHVEGPLLEEPAGEIDLTLLNTPADADEELTKKNAFERYQFNAWLSDRIGEKRRIPDTRHKNCPATFESNLPKASIIICFFNEAPSVLLRMVTSILTRTPLGLIEEILLIDDSSEMRMAFDAAEDVIRTRDEWLGANIRLLKTEYNQGLIRAKIYGAKEAKGEVIVFLDSHCEVNQHWLEPLLERIKGDRKRFVTPIIDIIDSDDMRYIGSPVCYGGFDWGLTFKWDYPHRSLLNNETFLTAPLKSPTMAGGLFAVDRNTFFEYGSYDEGMDIWGAENVEISFRIWMCGASLEVIPCSRIGHIFRRKRPYGLHTDTMGKNSMRAAVVWMDEYLPKFLAARPHLAHLDYGDIAERVKLRKHLQCKSFDWFLHNIYPPLLPGNKPNADEYQDYLVANDGKYLLRMKGSSLCLWADAQTSHVPHGTTLALRSCATHRMATWKWSATYELRNMGAARLCVDSLINLSLLKCHNQGSHQEWHLTKEGRLYSLAADRCINFANGSEAAATLEFCAIATQFEALRAPVHA